jgi:glycosyltransferase involved in cell wall biosynthesis
MKPGLISVVIPLYNHQRYIGDCLSSLYNQSYRDLEIILVDDGSTDRSLEIARASLASCPFPFQLREQDNQGAHAALNRGMGLAEGEYLSILNSDDRYHPRRLEILLRVARLSGRRLLFSLARHINEVGETLGRECDHRYYYLISRGAIRFFPRWEFVLLRHNLALTTSNFFIHRELAEEIGKFSNLTTCHDWEFLLRGLALEEPAYVDRELLDYRVHGESTLQKNPERREEEIDRVLSSYLSRVNHSANPRAPGPENWDGYWPIFQDLYLRNLEGYPRTGTWLKENRPDGDSNLPGLKGLYRRWAWRVYNQFLWQEESLREGKLCLKLRIHQRYIDLASRVLGRLGWLLK